MAFTQAQLDALDDVISGGELRVQYSDKAVQYRSLDEMLKLRKLMAAEIAGTAGTNLSALGGRRVTTYYDKGLEDDDCDG